MNGDELRIDVRRGGALYDETGDQRVNGTSFSLRAPTPASSGVCQNDSRTTDGGLGLTSPMCAVSNTPPYPHISQLLQTLNVPSCTQPWPFGTDALNYPNPSAPWFAIAASPLYRRWLKIPCSHRQTRQNECRQPSKTERITRLPGAKASPSHFST